MSSTGKNDTMVLKIYRRYCGNDDEGNYDSWQLLWLEEEEYEYDNTLPRRRKHNV